MREMPPMEGRRDTVQQNLHLSDQLEDDGELELSLGLSCGGSRNKGKETEGLNVTVATEATAEPVVFGEVSFGRPKYVRGSGLDAALRKFLEGRLDEQEESGRVLDGYREQQGQWELSGSCTKDMENSISFSSQGSTRALGLHDVQAYQEKLGQRDLVSDSDSKRKPSLFTEIQLQSGVGTALGQSGCQGLPLHFIDAMKSLPSAVGLATSSTAILSQFAVVNGDKEKPQRPMMQSDGLDQQKKFQEARKKRKYLIEEHKQQKKFKKEDDRLGLHGFRRPGSNSWVPGLDATAPAVDAERAFLALSETDNGEGVQEIRGALQSERDRAVVCSETEEGESTGTLGDDLRDVEVNFIPRRRTEDMAKISGVATTDMDGVGEDGWHLMSLQMHSSGNQTRTGLPDDIPGTAPENAPGQCSLPSADEVSSLSPQREVSASKMANLSGRSSSTGSHFSENKEEQSCDGDCEASSAPSASVGKDSVVVSSNAPHLTAGPTTSAALSYPILSLSVLPMPYSLPASGPNAPSVQFPMGFTFPYLMQYVPPTPDGQEQNSARPFNNSSLPIPSGHVFSTLQFPPSDGTPPWVQVLRPPTVSPSSHSNAAAGHSKISTGLAEDKSRHQVPLFDPLQILSDPVELDSFREQGGKNAFPGFAPSVQVAQAPPGALRVSANVLEDGEGRQEVRLGKGETATAQMPFRVEDPKSTEFSSFIQEEIGRALGGQFHRGSTNILPMPEGLAQDLAGLKPGIPPGLKFGGTGSCPDLPWVSTTGPGLNGRTICGVLYKFSRSQVKIVCACHGRHMSPSEFVRHAGGVDASNPEKNIVVNTSPFTSQPTSAG